MDLSRVWTGFALEIWVYTIVLLFESYLARDQGILWTWGYYMTAISVSSSFPPSSFRFPVRKTNLCRPASPSMIQLERAGMQFPSSFTFLSAISRTIAVITQAITTKPQETLKLDESSPLGAERQRSWEGRKLSLSCPLSFSFLLLCLRYSYYYCTGFLLLLIFLASILLLSSSFLLSNTFSPLYNGLLSNELPLSSYS